MRRILVSLLALGALSAGSLATHTATSRAAGSTASNSTPRFIVIHHPLSAAQLTSSGNLPTWSASFSTGGITYPFTMAGTTPNSGKTTTLPVVIVPLKMKFGSYTFDGSTKVVDTTNSPLFKTANFGSSLGTTQYLDAFQRAEFWGVGVSKNPNYHVLLSSTVASTVTMVIPPGFGTTTIDPSTGKRIGEVDVNYLDSQLTVLAATYKPNQIPVFLSYNTYATSGGCCIGGYHGAIGSGKNAQTYSWTTDTDPNVQGGFSNDINATSHELGELINDPFLNNTVPVWMVPSQPQYGCNTSLEVGDPLVLVDVSIPGFPSYHAQDLAEISWFAHRAPSVSYNQYYTFGNNFSTYASGAGC